MPMSSVSGVRKLLMSELPCRAPISDR
jgi:hypothetical protein